NPNKAKVNMGKIGTEWQRHIVNCISRRSSLCSFGPQCLCGYEPFIQNKANLETEDRRQMTDDGEDSKIRFNKGL
ncbi:MAG: hypothetical protein ACYTEW_03130, partial [Planctomycetota bacterium]